MSYALLLKWRDGDTHSASRDGIAAVLRDGRLGAIDGLVEAIHYAPAVVRDPLLAAMPSPDSLLVLHFRKLGELARACASGGALTELLYRSPLQALREHNLTAQAMWTQRYPVADAADAADASAAKPPRDGCAYWAGYEGDPPDPQAWVDEYRGAHVPLMQRFADVRAIEVYNRLDYSPADLPARCLNWMLRSRVLFDTDAALQAALHSPVRRALRAHRAGMPEHGGASEHVAMHAQSLELLPSALETTAPAAKK
ncbi:hypothetical protein [Paraburkholderia antibiotica]|uniref:EthD domain-containing protein n=1 Tax=Paraburkholderia antibiotica TaxID=2728839 RepID=A0A7X9X2I0_9BURK|nr:hypothetical protein [Paraburkholderia antibiotica]NML30227.1 hypothetical protein [Paraburkholderia antibiotica]